MTPVYEFLFLLFCYLMLPLLAAQDGNGVCPPSFNCGYLGNISFPFTKTERNHCGLLAIHNCDDPNPVKPRMIQFQNKGKWFEVVHLSQFPHVTSLFRDKDLYGLLQNRSCDAFRYNYTLPPSFPFGSFHIEYNVTMFSCNRTLHVRSPTYMHNYTKCPDYDLYYNPFSTADDALTACTKVQLPIKDVPDAKDPFTFVTADIFTQVNITKECVNCHYYLKGRCQLDRRDKFCCANGILQQNPWKHINALQ